MPDPTPRLSAEDETLLQNVGTAFSRLRRRTRDVPVDPPVAATDLRRDLLLTLVETSDEPLTVHAVAEALSLDQSGASRLASWCIDNRWLERVASQRDGRSITLRLTATGRETLNHSRRQQRQAFEYITAEWPVHERTQFVRLLHRYAEDAETRSRKKQPRQR